MSLKSFDELIIGEFYVVDDVSGILPKAANNRFLLLKIEKTKYDRREDVIISTILFSKEMEVIPIFESDLKSISRIS